MGEKLTMQIHIRNAIWEDLKQSKMMYECAIWYINKQRSKIQKFNRIFIYINIVGIVLTEYWDFASYYTGIILVIIVELNKHIPKLISSNEDLSKIDELILESSDLTNKLGSLFLLCHYEKKSINACRKELKECQCQLSKIIPVYNKLIKYIPDILEKEKQSEVDIWLNRRYYNLYENSEIKK